MSCGEHRAFFAEASLRELFRLTVLIYAEHNGENLQALTLIASRGSRVKLLSIPHEAQSFRNDPCAQRVQEREDLRKTEDPTKL